VTDAPHQLVLAVNVGLQVLSWFENLPKNEQPPRHIWWSDDLLSEWFENVEEERAARSSGKKRTSWDTGEDVPLMQNELTAGK
jgi:hypothetical protein